MEKRKSTKRSLLSSIVALMLCFTMLLGSTFAWFTDSAVSARNTIQSGNLDMKVSVKPYGAEYTEWTEVTESTEIFDDEALYEPGYTEAVWLKVENMGSLAFRYKMDVEVYDEVEGVNRAGQKFKLSDSLVVKHGFSTNNYESSESIYDSREKLLNNFNWKETKLSQKSVQVTNGNVLYSVNDAEQSDWSTGYICVVLHMPTDVGNEANHNGIDIPKVTFGLNAVATQVPHESDSFGTDYDADSEYPELPEVYEAATPDDLTKAIENAESGDIIQLTEDVNAAQLKIEKDVTIDLNDKTLTTSAWGGVLLKNGASLVNGTVKHTGAVAAIKAWNAGTIENVSIDITNASANNHITGIGVQEGASNGVDVIRNVTITGASQGIEVKNGSFVNLIEDVSVTAITINSNEGTALVINGGRIGKAVDSTFSGAVYGVNMLLKGEYDVVLGLEKCKVTSTSNEEDKIALWAHDEKGISNTTNCSLTLTYDADTKFDGIVSEDFEDECKGVVTINKPTTTE